MTQTTGPLGELPFTLELSRGTGLSLALQLTRHLRSAALSGALPAGVRLPGSRRLAQQLGVTRGVVVDAYAELLADGTLESQVGSGTRVACGLRRSPSRETSQEAAAPGWWPPAAPVAREAVRGDPALISFRLGEPSVALLNMRAWRSCWNAVSRQVPPSDYGDPAGEPSLRTALAAFVSRTRGYQLRPEQIVVTSGAAQSFNLLASLLPSGSVVAVEDPGYPLVRRVAERYGLKVRLCRVDESGLMPQDLTPDVRLICVTPSHQYPLGVRMSLPRRLQLLEWAAQHDALVAEDDYDGEFRYDAAPLPALASLDTLGRVVYLGTLSKVLSPSLRLGYLGVPLALVDAAVQAKSLADLGNPWAVQHFAASLLLSGELDRHLGRMRRHYAAQRTLLGRVLEPLAPHAVLGGIEAGLHVCLHLASPLNAAQLSVMLRQRGVEALTLGDYSAAFQGEGLLLGYGGLTRSELERGATIIAEVVRAQLHYARNEPTDPPLSIRHHHL